MGALDSLSIGYMVLDEYEGADGVIHLVSIIINEVSIVTFPACKASRVLSVKNKQEEQQDIKPVRVPSWAEIKAKASAKSKLMSLVSKIKSK
ncbi:Caudovirus prohead protease [compost metagenome]